MVLPLSFLSGHDSKRVRKLAAKNYGEICAISISAYTDPEASFSSNTDMAECLLVGRKTGHRSRRAIFGILSSAPSRPFDGAAIGRIMRHTRKIRKLEDGPVGGTPIRIGDDTFGVLIDCPLPGDGEPWSANRMADVSVAQAAYQVAHCSHLWLPSMPESEAVPIPMRNLGAPFKSWAYRPRHRWQGVRRHHSWAF
jgi:hypothetical protein